MYLIGKSKYENNIVIKLCSEETLKLVKFVKGQRKYFGSEFTKFLSAKLQNHGIKCWLGKNSNWFKKNNSRKSNSHFWTGKYECIQCGMSYFASMLNNNNHGCELYVNWNGNSSHNKVLPKVRCSGKNRDKLKASIINCGVEETQQNNFFFNQSLGSQESNEGLFLCFTKEYLSSIFQRVPTENY